MAEENIYEKIDEEYLYEKPFDEPDAQNEPKYENQCALVENNMPAPEAIYSEIDVQNKSGRSLSPEYMNTKEATEEVQEMEEAQDGVGLYEVPAGENGEVASRRSSASSTERQPCDEEQLLEATYEDNPEDGMMMAYSLPKVRATETEEEVVEYSLKPVQNSNGEDEEEPLDSSQPEIALFVKVGAIHYIKYTLYLSCIHTFRTRVRL